MKVEKVRLGYGLEPDPLRNFLLKNRELDLVWNQITQVGYLIFKLSPDLSFFFLFFKNKKLLVPKKFKTLKELMIFMKYMAKKWQF
jgi:hypothetical protein